MPYEGEVGASRRPPCPAVFRSCPGLGGGAGKFPEKVVEGGLGAKSTGETGKIEQEHGNLKGGVEYHVSKNGERILYTGQPRYDLAGNVD